MTAAAGADEHGRRGHRVRVQGHGLVVGDPAGGQGPVAAAVGGLVDVAAVERGELNATEIETLTALLARTRKLADLYCTGCGYCMPCPGGIDIPRRFEAMNYERVYGLSDHARRIYSRTRAREERSDGGGVCTDCGACEEKCPQGIQVRDQLRETAEALAED